MTSRLANRLSQARRRRFVGRSAELELFGAALNRAQPDFCILHLHGPGGVGKSSLLREFARLAEEAGRQVVLLDGRHLDPSPSGFLLALQTALALPLDASLAQALGEWPSAVLLLDTYELVAPLDTWLREEFLPQLPEQALVVIAGRQPPPAAWRADDGWGELTRIVALRNLLPDESRAYLRGQGLDEAEIGHVLGVTYGHPLALSLAADLYGQQRSTNGLDLRQNPDTLRILLERFAADVADPYLRQALEVCAHAFNTDESLLIHCLGADHGPRAFRWLRDLSFIEQGPFGLFPHDLAREVLEADLRWRNLPRFRELHHQVRNYIIQQIRSHTGVLQQRAIFALLFLHRNNPFMRPFYEWQSMGQLYIEQAQPADMPVIEQITRCFQGEAAVAITRHWAASPRAAFYVFRGAGQAVAGFAFVVEISQLTDADLAVDPAMAAAAKHLAGIPPLRQGDTVLYFRNWMDTEYYQQSPSIFNMAAMVSLRYFFNTPTLAYSMISQGTSEVYASMYEYLRMPQAQDATFTLDGQEFGVFAHDWRSEPVLDWIDIMGERELLDEIVALESLPVATPPVVLSEPEFVEAVRQSLRDLLRPDLLARSPLLRSRCLRDRHGDAATPVHLQALLREGAALLDTSARSRKLHRALWHTYFEPAPSQEAAAELLDLPFSTYRYQLGKAIDQLVAWLWQQEVYGVDSA